MCLAIFQLVYATASWYRSVPRRCSSMRSAIAVEEMASTGASVRKAGMGCTEHQPEPFRKQVLHYTTPCVAWVRYVEDRCPLPAKIGMGRQKFGTMSSTIPAPAWIHL